MLVIPAMAKATVNSVRISDKYASYYTSWPEEDTARSDHSLWQKPGDGRGGPTGIHTRLVKTDPGVPLLQHDLAARHYAHLPRRQHAALQIPHLRIPPARYSPSPYFMEQRRNRSL